MKAFEVYVDGEKICTAGFPKPRSLNALVFVELDDEGQCNIVVGGSEGPERLHQVWEPITFGKDDEVTIRFGDADAADPPIGEAE